MLIKKIIDFFKMNNFILYLFIGAINTTFGYLIFLLLTFVGLHYTITLFISTLIGIVFNFFTTGRIVFKNSDNRLIFQFFLIYSIIYLINITLVKYFLIFGISIYFSGLISTILCAMIGYVFFKILFRKATSESVKTLTVKT